MHREAWRDTVHGIAESQAQLSHKHQHSCLENSTDRGAWWLPFMGHKESDTTENPPLSYTQLMEFV